MNTPKQIVIAIGMLIGIFLGGTAGYMLLEDYSFFEGLYMSAITISTVGYGEVKPLSPVGQGFSIVLIGCSVVGLALAGRALGESLLENAWSGKSERRKMQRRIQALKTHHIICGHGREGCAAAKQLAAARAAFVVVDQKPLSGTTASEADYPFIEGDATHDQTLLDAGIKNAKGLLALLGSDPENVFLVLTARELNPTLQIIARANDPMVESKLLKAGADRVISPFTTAGKQVANEMLLATDQHHAPCAERTPAAAPQWISLETGDDLVGSSVSVAGVQLGGPVIGLRRGQADRLMPADEEILRAGDSILALASPRPANDMHGQPAANRNIVIIDDNPVITKLYTRLFQKAGFIPHTAADGTAGLELIGRIRPTAAVIDFMLPVFSGIEICSQVRKNDAFDSIRLILFTADDNAETRVRALNAGADAVVVKSPNAQEVIETVLAIISQNKK